MKKKQQQQNKTKQNKTKRRREQMVTFRKPKWLQTDEALGQQFFPER